MCKISVVTSVYNCEKFIAETIESVQKQTITDWEYIVIDDCSKDNSGNIIANYAKKDERIKYIKNTTNKGQCANLNYGISLAKGDYIARLDHDDICYNNRFEKQLAFMAQNPNVLLCGSYIDTWHSGKIHKGNGMNLDISNSQEARFASLFCSIIAHSTFFMKKSIFDDGLAYDKKYVYAEDFALITDVLLLGDIGLIKEPLVAYRVFPEQTTQKCPNTIKENERKTIILNYLEKIQINFDKDIFVKAVNGELASSDIKRFENFIYEYARICGVGNSKDEIKNNICVKEIYRLAYNWQKCDIGLLKAYINSELRLNNWLFKRKGLSLIKRFLHHLIDKEVCHD